MRRLGIVLVALLLAGCTQAASGPFNPDARLDGGRVVDRRDDGLGLSVRLTMRLIEALDEMEAMRLDALPVE